MNIKDLICLTNIHCHTCACKNQTDSFILSVYCLKDGLIHSLNFRVDLQISPDDVRTNDDVIKLLSGEQLNEFYQLVQKANPDKLLSYDDAMKLRSSAKLGNRVTLYNGYLTRTDMKKTSVQILKCILSACGGEI